MSDDASDLKAINDKRSAQGRRDKANLDIVVGILSTFDGRAWLYGKLEACHIFSTSYDPDSARNTDFRLGEQNIGLRLLEEITRANPDSYVLMIKEGKENG